MNQSILFPSRPKILDSAALHPGYETKNVHHLAKNRFSACGSEWDIAKEAGLKAASCTNLITSLRTLRSLR